MPLRIGLNLKQISLLQRHHTSNREMIHAHMVIHLLIWRSIIFSDPSLGRTFCNSEMYLMIALLCHMMIDDCRALQIKIKYF